MKARQGRESRLSGSISAGPAGSTPRWPLTISVTSLQHQADSLSPGPEQHICDAEAN